MPSKKKHSNNTKNKKNLNNNSLLNSEIFNNKEEFIKINKEKFDLIELFYIKILIERNELQERYDNLQKKHNLLQKSHQELQENYQLEQQKLKKLIDIYIHSKAEKTNPIFNKEILNFYGSKQVVFNRLEKTKNKLTINNKMVKPSLQI